MKRDMSATDDILIASSSTRELAENSCIKNKNDAIVKSHINSKCQGLRQLSPNYTPHQMIVILWSVQPFGCDPCRALIVSQT